MSRVLISNDDGLFAPGIAALVDRFAGDHELLVIAPGDDVSGSGTSLGTLVDGAIITSSRETLPGHPDVEAHRVDAPPAFAVMAAALGAFGPAPDVVIIGINVGFNVGSGILFSSTVGAALTAASAGLPAIAVSAADHGDPHLDVAAGVVLDLLDFAGARPGGSVLNVNVPARPHADLRGTIWTDLAPSGDFRLAMTQVAEGVRLNRVPRVTVDMGRDGAVTDREALADGFVSITEVRACDAVVRRRGPVDLTAAVASH